MERKLFVFGLILACLVFSCGTTTNIYDESIPLEESAVLKITRYFTVKSYNGIPVQLQTKDFYDTGFTIPAGNTTLILDFDSGNAFSNQRTVGNTTTIERNQITGKDVTLTFNFEAGKEYQLLLAFVDKEGNYKATNVGDTYLALLVCQNNDYKNPLHSLLL